MAAKDPTGVTDPIQETVTSADATGGLTVKSATAGKTYFVTDLIISTDTEMSVELQDSDNTPILQQIYLPATSVFSKTFDSPLAVTLSKGLKAVASAAGNVSVTIVGYQE